MDNIIKIKDLVEQEKQRQENEICLIASENYMSKDVMEVCGSVLINKYSEGRPNINISKTNDKEIFNYDESEYNRYYAGCKYIDEIEKIAIENACKLFKCKYANVQPNSGCQANQAVYMALLKSNDTILAMDINSGSHISHSLPIGFAGKYHNVVTYGLDENEFINYEEIRDKLYQYKPRLLIVGASAYSRIIDFESIRQIVDEYNDYIKDALCWIGNEETKQKEYDSKKCYLMVDMAHIAGLVATGLHPSPLPYADVVTSTVQKTLRSGRGGIILTNDRDIAKKVDKAVFPCLQGGPLNNMIAAKAIGFEEALQPSFTEYQTQVLKNIKAMEEVFNERNVKMVSNGSDNHLILLDLRDKGISGKQLEDALSDIGIVVNKNAVKDDPLPKAETSGVRIGTACITTRGAKENMAEWIAHKICDVIDILTDTYDYSRAETLRKAMVKVDHLSDKELILENIKGGVKYFCEEHPIYEN